MSLLSSVVRKLRVRPTEEPITRVPGFDYADDPNIERVIFICGLHRSGTTLLESLMTSRFDVSFLRATVPESEGQHLQTVYSPAKSYGGPGKFAFSRQAEMDIRELTDHAAYRERIMSEWRRFVVGKSPVLIEKSPPNLTKIGWLRQVFPKSQFVIVARDPRAVAGATQKWSGSSLPELMMHWNSAYSQALEDFDERDCTVSRYEDLMENSADELERIGRFLKLKPRPVSEEMQQRFKTLNNSNSEYIRAHAGARYGSGVWEQFGYTV